MSDHVVRLSWALPLVLLIGVGVILALRRFVPAAGGVSGMAASHPSQPIVTSTQALSEYTKLLVIRHNGQDYLLVESTASVQFQLARPSEPFFTRRA